MAFLKPKELRKAGFKYVHPTALISDKAVFYGIQFISVGAHSRIDDFVILSAGEEGIEVGRYVHIACYASVLGQGKTTFADFSAISGGTRVYSSSDPYDGSFMTNPCVPAKVGDVILRQTYHKPVYFGKHVVVGAGSVVLPGALLHDYCSVGAMALVRGTLNTGGIYAGVPAKYIKSRDFRRLKELEQILDAISKDN